MMNHVRNEVSNPHLLRLCSNLTGTCLRCVDVIVLMAFWQAITSSLSFICQVHSVSGFCCPHTKMQYCYFHCTQIQSTFKSPVCNFGSTFHFSIYRNCLPFQQFHFISVTMQ